MRRNLGKNLRVLSGSSVPRRNDLDSWLLEHLTSTTCLGWHIPSR